MSATGLLLSDDLLFASRIIGTARSLGLEIKSARSAAEVLAEAQAKPTGCVLVDLQNPGLDIVALVQNLKNAANTYIVGYGSHVDTATLKAAREAGCDLVLPRSKFVEDLSAELPKWIGQTAP
jgi:CheY-like chemotaxis protein